MVPKGYEPKKRAKYGEGKWSTPYTGVKVAQSGNGYQVRVKFNKKEEDLGVYDTAEKAAITRDRFILQHGLKNKRSLPNTEQDLTKPGPKQMQVKLKSSNTTGYRGVKPVGEKFRATIKIGDTQNNIGYYKTAKQAGKAYDRAAIKNGWPNHRLNWPDGIPSNEDSSEEDDSSDDENDSKNKSTSSTSSSSKSSSVSNNSSNQKYQQPADSSDDDSSDDDSSDDDSSDDDSSDDDSSE